MNKIQELFEKYGFDLENDNDAAELCDEIYKLFKRQKNISQPDECNN